MDYRRRKQSDASRTGSGGGQGRRAVRYRLRDWLFSRQRYWGEPAFPILHELDEHGRPTGLTRAVPMRRAAGATAGVGGLSNRQGGPEPPLAKVTAWVELERDGRRPLRRETNTRCLSGRASCWYFLGSAIPRTTGKPGRVRPSSYWMPVDLYVGGAEHAVLHLLYARFWHKVLFDRGHVSTP